MQQKIIKISSFWSIFHPSGCNPHKTSKNDLPEPPRATLECPPCPSRCVCPGCLPWPRSLPEGLKSRQKKKTKRGKKEQDGLRRPLGWLLGRQHGDLKSPCCILNDFGPPGGEGGSRGPQKSPWGDVGRFWAAARRSRGPF